MHRVLIAGSGVHTPAQVVTNEELVEAYNAYAHRQNTLHAAAIEAGERAPLDPSSEAFIEKASGIRQRHVVTREGVLDPGVMHPLLPERADDELSLMAEIGVAAADKALAVAGLGAADIDAVICAASNHERPYPAIAIEIQAALGMSGFAFDMNVACSSATFAIQIAADMIRTGTARAVLIVNPEITSGHLEWRDRDCHFIFGDVCTALVLTRMEEGAPASGYEVLSTRCMTQFSNAIRNNNGFLRRSREGHMQDRRDMQFRQEGRKVFKQVVPMVVDLLAGHLGDEGLAPADLSRLWLHQANKAMNDLIAAKLLGREPTRAEQPNVLQDYANTSSAGSIIAFSQFGDDLAPGSLGVICSFGAGYSAGSVIVRKV
jgi:beta-ketodecanoyl-[acyl-carrier-protein] synthase